jgi:predicted transcriptional regulator
MDQVYVVRHKVLIEGRSQRAVARELGISRVTVRKYLSQAAPSRQETAARARPVAAVEHLRRAGLKPRWTPKTDN